MINLMLNKKQKYLQIALNNTLVEAKNIIGRIPLDKRIIIEAGTPLIKAYGGKAVREIKNWWTQRIIGQISGNIDFPKEEIRTNVWWANLILQSLEKKRKQKNLKNTELPFAPYIVADLKCMDRGGKEVEIAREGGASAAVALGHAPIETLDAFIEECEKQGLDSMIDMMNVGFPLEIIRQLKKPPQVVILHRGVDEEVFDPESEIPYHEIQRIKSECDIMIAVAGGDTFQEVQRAIFNDADIVVVWKSFYQSTAETAKLAEEFLKEIR